jgi:hypothetical protein
MDWGDLVWTSAPSSPFTDHRLLGTMNLAGEPFVPYSGVHHANILTTRISQYLSLILVILIHFPLM